MKEEELKKLIERYYKGESTEDEEMALREYFRQNDVSGGYDTEKVIFGYYKASGEVPEPSPDFKDRILAGIDDSAGKNDSKRIRSRVLQLLSAAAGLLILAGSYFFFIHRAESQDTFSDPKIAYAETMKILMEVSSQLNHGTQALEPVGKIKMMTSKSFQSINKSTKIIERSLEKINHLQNTSQIKNTTLEKNRNK